MKGISELGAPRLIRSGSWMYAQLTEEEEDWLLREFVVRGKKRHTLDNYDDDE